MTDSPPHRRHRTAAGIDDWRPEDPEFWESTGRPVARRNLIWSILAEHLGFSVWLLWSVSAALLAKVGFDFTVSQLFFLVAVPNLVGVAAPAALHVRGAAVRRPQLDGRERAAAARPDAALRVRGAARRRRRTGRSCLIAATAGVGGGNFACSMANINFFYPPRKKGSRSGSTRPAATSASPCIQFFLPIVVGGAGALRPGQGERRRLHLERAGYLYAALAVVGGRHGVPLHEQPAPAPSRARDVARW